MTNEEAREHLKDILADVPNDKCIDWIEALKQAIKTLEQQPCEDAISRDAVITKIEDEDSLSFMGVFCDHYAAMGFRETIKELPSVTPSIPDVENDFNLGYNCGYADAMIDIAESEVNNDDD